MTKKEQIKSTLDKLTSDNLIASHKQVEAITAKIETVKGILSKLKSHVLKHE